MNLPEVFDFTSPPNHSVVYTATWYPTLNQYKYIIPVGTSYASQYLSKGEMEMHFIHDDPWKMVTDVTYTDDAFDRAMGVL